MSLEGKIADSDVFRSALQAVRRATAIRSLTELNQTFEPAVINLGFDGFVGALISDCRRRMGLKVLFGKGLEAWERRYLDMHYERDDAVLDECRKSVDPFYWSEVSKRLELSDAARQVLSDARAFGLHEGFVAPIHKPDRSIFIVLFAGHYPRFRNADGRAATHMLATYYGLAGLRLCQGDGASQIYSSCLTSRQRECLEWVRAGKSSTDIATILRISPGVVDEHVANACKRLGVATRMQAVLTAADMGYFDK